MQYLLTPTGLMLLGPPYSGSFRFLSWLLQGRGQAVRRASALAARPIAKSPDGLNRRGVPVHDSSTVNTKHPRITRTRTGAWISNPAAGSQSPRICNQGTRRELRFSGARSGYSKYWVPTVSRRSVGVFAGRRLPVEWFVAMTQLRSSWLWLAGSGCCRTLGQRFLYEAFCCLISASSILVMNFCLALGI